MKVRAGTVFRNPKHRFHDGEEGNKIFVTLSHGLEHDYYVSALTTSQPHRKRGYSPGCQSKDPYPNFFLPKGAYEFHTDTWIVFGALYRENKKSILKRMLDREIIYLFDLPVAVAIEVMECVANSDDIDEEYEEMIRDSIVQLKTGLEGQVNDL